jgi:hypothetical protein
LYSELLPKGRVGKNRDFFEKIKKIGFIDIYHDFFDFFDFFDFYDIFEILRKRVGNWKISQKNFNDKHRYEVRPQINPL